MEKRPIDRKREAVHAVHTLGFLRAPGSHQICCKASSWASRTRFCLQIVFLSPKMRLFPFSPTLLAAGASPKEGGLVFPHTLCSGLSLLVAGSAWQGSREVTVAQGCAAVALGGHAQGQEPGSPAASPDARGKRSLPLRPSRQHPAW